MITNRTSSSIFPWLRQVKKVKLTSTNKAVQTQLHKNKGSTYDSDNPPTHKINRYSNSLSQATTS